MIQKITTDEVTYYEYRDSSLNLFAFSLPELFRDLENIYKIDTNIFKINLN